MEARAVNQHSTIKIFENLPEGVRAELIDGVIVSMASPADIHQDIAIELATQLRTYLRGKSCFARYEFDVQLNKNDPWNVVRPDIIVVCDRSKNSLNRIIGAPDMIIEVVSPSTIRRDRVEKLNLYKRAGVQEYWIVYPDEESGGPSVDQLVLRDGEYIHLAHEATERVSVHCLEDCVIDLQLVFPQTDQADNQAAPESE